ncbi:uncharacterized protein LOC124915472 [Impatiens glandulifera]|uniref:uncharacterized protein LOC124915472 n=1 Tax=Impatiens glandulifera TaxID=253017 RepID=UPI001FB17644|nr:uncharacterized protein LOC124915472 [Impatiens glandulifera]
MFSTQNNNMVSLELEAITPAPVNTSSPRISFSADFLNEDEVNLMSLRISPASKGSETEKERLRNPDFEFLSGDLTSQAMISTADELFFEGKMLPFLQKQQSKIELKEEKEVNGPADQEERKTKRGEKEEEEVNKKEESNRMNNNWFLDEDPSPRPPKCTVLWKELLRLKKQRPPPPSYLSPSSSSSSSSSGSTLGEIDQEAAVKEKEKEKERRIKKGGLERTRSATIRIRPMVNVPICTHTKSNSLPPLFSQRSQGGIRNSTTTTARDHQLRHK